MNFEDCYIQLSMHPIIVYNCRRKKRNEENFRLQDIRICDSIFSW